jgi:hypothetical protein
MPPLANAVADREDLYATSRVFLEMNGQFVGWVDSVSGGYTKAQLGVVQDEKTRALMKRVAGIEVEDLEVYFRVDMAPTWWQWVSDSMGARPGLPRDMAVIRTDFDGRQLERVVLMQARITQVEFPTFDAASKNPAIFKVVITAGSSQYQKMSGEAGPALPNTRLATSTVLGNAFRFELGGLPTTRMFRVAPPVVSIGFPEDSVGAYREYALTAATVSIGNLIVNRPRTNNEDQQYFDWLRHFLIEGQNSPGNELPSSLSLLAPDLQTVLLTIHFGHVGLVSIDPYQSMAEGSPAAMQVEMYVNRMWLELGR